jgi:hypothetical protein
MLQLPLFTSSSSLDAAPLFCVVQMLVCVREKSVFFFLQVKSCWVVDPYSSLPFVKVCVECTV